jgi:hypothetical protein
LLKNTAQAPQWLKPVQKEKLYRSVETLRHPKPVFFSKLLAAEGVLSLQCHFFSGLLR